MERDWWIAFLFEEINGYKLLGEIVEFDDDDDEGEASKGREASLLGESTGKTVAINFEYGWSSF